MGFKIKNSLTGEFEKLPILTLKGEKGETGGVEEYNKVDYMGNKYETLKQANDANVEYAVKTAIGEFNYLDYDGQHITATDTIEGRSKSAILSGNTLKKDAFVKWATAYGNNVVCPIYHDGSINRSYKVYANRRYTVIRRGIWENVDYSFYNDTNEYIQGNIKSETFIPNVDGYIQIFVDGGEELRTEDNYKNFIVIEGEADKSIPYFEGMQSVKMPVLTTGTSRNMWSKVNDSGETYAGFRRLSKLKIPVFEGETIYIRATGGPGYSGVVTYDENGEKIKDLLDIIGDVMENTYIVEKGVKYIAPAPHQRYVFSENETIMYNRGSGYLPYEENVSGDYKSNILTVNEDVELRGIGDVRDELDLMTGELVQRTGKFMVDGTEDFGWYGDIGETLYGFNIYKSSIVEKLNNEVDANRPSLCSALEYRGTTMYGKPGTGFAISGGSDSAFLQIVLQKEKLSDTTLDGIKQYLSENPLYFVVPLLDKSIKTVDLSDNHVYSYKGTTHYDCSSAEGSLVPTLSVKVPTDVQATIAQQRETIQTLNSENERLNQIQEALKASMLDSQVQLMNLIWDTDFEVFTLRESIAPKDFLLDSRTGSNIDKFSQAKFIIENDCPDLEKLNSQIEYYFSKDVFSQEQFEELTDLISIVKGENGCEY